MKRKIIFLSVIQIVLAFTIKSQHDTMYIMKAGVVVRQYSLDTEIDSIIFYRPVSGTFTDTRDNNEYRWVNIGNQVWMAENLKYLPEVTGSGTGSITTPSYYVHGYNGTVVADAKATSNYSTYGVLYNWPAAMDGSSSSTTNPSGVQGVCPTGWHLPSSSEFTELTDYLGGTLTAGGSLKETSTTHWTSPNNGATDDVNFTALPGGYRVNTGSFGHLGTYGHWWTTSVYDATLAWSFYLYYNEISVYNNASYKEMGFSVRCVKD